MNHIHESTNYYHKVHPNWDYSFALSVGTAALPEFLNFQYSNSGEPATILKFIRLFLKRLDVDIFSPYTTVWDPEENRSLFIRGYHPSWAGYSCLEAIRALDNWVPIREELAKLFLYYMDCQAFSNQSRYFPEALRSAQARSNFRKYFFQPWKPPWEHHFQTKPS